MEDKVLYFGYGANRDARMMKAITGADLKGKPAVLRDFKLVVQKLDQLPDTILSTAPAPVSPRAAVAANWLESFESYNIKENPDGKVTGTLWELTPQERELVRDWELVDFGWYEDKKVKIITQDGQEVEAQTEGLRAGQKYDREVDGMSYETWLNPPEDFDWIASKSREEYFARQTNEDAVGSLEAR